MEAKQKQQQRRQQQQQQSCPSPPPDPPYSLLKDISNFRTPKHPPHNPSLHSPCPQLFTASKQTPQPSSSFRCRRRPSLAPSTSAVRSKAARRLKAFELEQSKSARKAQIRKEKSLKSFSKSLTVWLNFLFQNPKTCGCDISKLTGEYRSTESARTVLGNGKRDSWPGVGVGVDRAWRSPKRQRDLSWRGVVDADMPALANSMFSALQFSLQEVCSFDDLKQRMRIYLSLASCKEIFNVMTQVTKNIDEGRIKMKPNCPIVSDVGMKEKAMRILMCYNPIWLRIGLYIILGGDTLLSNENVNSEQEIAFLKMVIEKLFLSHAGLAKAYAYNKLVEGLYRPGYFETLANVILKRFLLLVLILDRAKSQSSLPIKYGIDGLDGGSPLLFTLQSSIKSSRQVIHDFLSSDVMHGEGNLLAHLVIVGYKVSYQQSPLLEYDFRVTDMFEDLRDGMRLCRAIQLLQHDSSILMKTVVPSDTRKKNLVNCGIALQHLKQAGVPLYDDDGAMIIGEDIVNGDKELILSLLWNIFVHLQLPLLINRTLLSEEISKIHGGDMGYMNTSTLLDMLLYWIQAICEGYDFRVDNFSSLVDGKAMWCLLDYYFRKELHCSCSSKDLNKSNGEASIMSAIDYSDAVHNFILSQKLMTLLGKFPEVLQVSDILEDNGACNDRSVIILLVFLSFQLIVKKNMDQLNFHKLLGFNCQSPERKHLSTACWSLHSEAVLHQDEMHGYNTEDTVRNFKVIMAWWQDMAQRNSKCGLKPATPVQCFSTGRWCMRIQRETAAKIIQSHFRRSIKRHNYLQTKNAVSFLQCFIRAWLTIKKNPAINKFRTHKAQELSYEMWKQLKTIGRHTTFMSDRHNFATLERSVVIIQHATRALISRRRHHESVLAQDISTPGLLNAVVVFQKCIRGWTTRSMYNKRVAKIEKGSLSCEENEVRDLQNKAASKIQLAWKMFASVKFASEENEVHDLQMKAASKIQLAWKKFAVRNSLCCQHFAATKIQSYYRGRLLRKSFLNQKQAITKIQSVFRCLRCWRDFQQHKIATMSPIFNSLRCQHLAAIKIQSYCRGWLLRKSFLNQKQAIIKIQSIFRCIRCWRDFKQYKIATKSAIIIQSHVRGWIARRGVHRHRYVIVILQSHCRGWLKRRELLFKKEAAIRIQSDFRCITYWKLYNIYRHAAIEIQRFVRGEITRKRLLGASCLHEAVPSIGCTFKPSRVYFQSLELKIFLQSVVKLQRWWRGVLSIKSRLKSAIIIQSHVRGWIARRGACRERGRILIIQSYWKGYLARKDLRGQLLDLRLRVQKSAANVDDNMRIINRLVVALSELLSMKSVSGILHTCATLDMTTQHSQKCCEKLVDVGAVDTLLKLIRSVSRSIPDQEVLKHALSTLRNLARYPHLVEALIDSRGSVETILWELLRNKEEGYHTASEVLKKICSSQKGVEAARNLPALVKRLHNLVEDLTRRAGNEKRNARGMLARERTERRLREAVELLKLITNG